MKSENKARLLFAALLLIARLVPAAQNQFTDAEAGGIKTFLRDNFRETNACIVIGLVDEGGNRFSPPGNSTTEPIGK